MAHKPKHALAPTRERRKDHPAIQSPKRPDLEPRSRCIPVGTHQVELKSRSTEAIAEHLRRSSKPVEWNTDDSDVD